MSRDPIGNLSRTTETVGSRAWRPGPQTRLMLDHTVRRYAAGTLLLGGSPLRLVRLSASGAGRLDRWLDGEPLGEDAIGADLARRLLDAGLLYSVPVRRGCLSAAVTLVVPVKDNHEGLARLLAATADVRHRIVVDDGSKPPVPAATLRHDAPHGPAAARNAGWRRATTELVVFLDSDVVPEPGWLEPVLPLFDDPLVAAVAPRVRSMAGDNDLSGVEHHDLSVVRRDVIEDAGRSGIGDVGEKDIGHAAGWRSALVRYEAARSSLDMGPHPAVVQPMSRVGYVPTAALVVRRTALAAVGGFDERLRFGEDVDFVWRLIDAGHLVRYQPAAVVWHQPRTSLRAWFGQRFGYGTSAAPLASRHPDRLSCAQVNVWSLLSWGLLCTGRPAAAAFIGGGTAALLARRLHGRGLPTDAALALAARSHLGAGRLLGEAVRRAWWPAALLTRAGRRALALSLIPGLVEAVGHSPRWAALRVADDTAYSLGVLAGCIRHRTVLPLLPRLSSRRPQ